MTLLLGIVAQLLHIGLVLLAAPLLAGALSVAPAWLAGRTPPPFAQPWRDLLRQLRKQAIRNEAASIVGRMAPTVSVALAGVAVCLIPSFALGMVSAPMTDLLSLLAVLGLGRTMRVLAVLDTGNGAGGAAAAASGRLAVLAEPAVWLAVFALALLAGGGTLDRIVAARLDGGMAPGAAALAGAGLALLAWAACAAPPMDTARSGSDLVLSQIADALNRLAWCDLIGALVLPYGMATAEAGPLAWAVGLLAWVGRLLLAVGLLSAGLSVASAPRVRSAVVLALVLAVLGAVLALAGKGGA